MIDPVIDVKCREFPAIQPSREGTLVVDVHRIVGMQAHYGWTPETEYKAETEAPYTRIMLYGGHNVYTSLPLREALKRWLTDPDEEEAAVAAAASDEEAKRKQALQIEERKRELARISQIVANLPSHPAVLRRKAAMEAFGDQRMPDNGPLVADWCAPYHPSFDAPLEQLAEVREAYAAVSSLKVSSTPELVRWAQKKAATALAHIVYLHGKNKLDGHESAVVDKLVEFLDQEKS